jgi:predicted nucleotidyltransferase
VASSEFPRQNVKFKGLTPITHMTRQELINRSEAYIVKILREHIPPQVGIYLYGSRVQGDNRWNSDYDIWIDGEIPARILRELSEELEESFVPFRVEIVTTPQLTGRFGERVQQEARPWI